MANPSDRLDMQSATLMERPTPPDDPAASALDAAGGALDSAGGALDSAGGASAASSDPRTLASRSPFAAPAPDPQERLVIERAQRGDCDAFRELVERHQQRAFRIARHMTPNDEDARDLVQEAFLRVFRSLERFDFQYSFSTWLHRIVTNLAIDHLRKRRVAAAGFGSDAGSEGDEIEFDPRDPRGASPAERLEVQETGRKVRDCIGALAPHFQSVLLLREIEGLPCNEIAKIVGATHVTVRWRLHRGRKLFQEEWERRERLEAGAGRSSAPGEGREEDREPKGTRAGRGRSGEDSES
jgi:RNA polymerase sigma-70 factor (ECF subfamily)